MIYLLPTSLITNQLLDVVITKLKNKTNMFDYIDEDKYKERIKNKELAIWITNRLICIGQFNTCETGLNTCSLTVVNSTDDIDTDYVTDLKQLEQILKDIGVDRIIVDGRKGWLRKLPDYSLSSVKLIKDL